MTHESSIKQVAVSRPKITLLMVLCGVVGLAGLQRVREAVRDIPLVAIGGIDHSNARSVFDHGATSVAVISSALVPSTSISANISSLIQSFPRA